MNPKQSRSAIKAKIYSVTVIYKMGGKESRCELSEYEWRRLVRDPAPVPTYVKNAVEAKLMRDPLEPLDKLRKYLDRDDMSRPKKAKQKELSWKELQKGCNYIDHPQYNYLTQDYTQFYYDCCWYEYFLRTL